MVVAGQFQDAGDQTSFDSHKFITKIVTAMRQILYRAISDASTESFSAQFQDKAHPKNHSLLGYCSFSQAVAAYALKDRGFDPKPFSSQSLSGSHPGHASLSVRIGQKLYIIDPTYRQFYDPAMREMNGKPMPGFLLEQKDGGPDLLTELIENGFFEVTPEKAHLYLASLCGGKAPFETAAQSMEYLSNPTYDNVYEHFSRARMSEGGHLIPLPPL